MKHYINADEKIFAFEEDGSQDHLITSDMKPISYEKVLERTKKPEQSIEEWRSTASVSARQGMEQLIRTGLDEDLDSKIDAIEDPLQRKLTRNWINKAQVWERNKEQFIELGEALGLTDEQMDEHIRAASKL